MNSNAIRRAFTILEISVAFTLFMIAVVAVMESLTAARNLSSNMLSRDALTFNANNALRAIASDLSTSGWHFADDPDTTAYAETSRATDRTLRYYPFVQIQKTPTGNLGSGLGTSMPWTEIEPSILATRRALPVELLGAPADTETAFGLATGTDATWLRSFHARSQGLVFLRTTIGSWTQTEDPTANSNRNESEPLTDAAYDIRPPSSKQRPSLNFGTGIDSNRTPLTINHWRREVTDTYDPRIDLLGVMRTSNFFETTAMSGDWQQRYPNQPYGVVLDAGWLDTTGDDLVLRPLWETMTRQQLVNTGTVTAPVYEQPPTILREFMYAVVPSPLPFSYGRLVRAYRQRNSASVTLSTIPVGTEPGNRLTVIAVDNDSATPTTCAMLVDQVLAEDVVRIVCDTVRTADAKTINASGDTVKSVGLNQVRIRLYMARPQVTNPDIMLSSVIETTIAMRARGSSGDMAEISSTLGTTPIGIER